MKGHIFSNPETLPHAPLKWSLETPGTESGQRGRLQKEQLGESGVLNILYLLIWVTFM